MKRLLVPVGAFVLLFFMSIALERLLGGERPWLNSIRHLSLGAVNAWFFAEAWRQASFDSYKAPPWWFRAATIIAGATFLGVCWELFEFQFDLVVSRMDIGSPYDDTMHDLSADIIGALLTIPVFLRVRDRPVSTR